MKPILSEFADDTLEAAVAWQVQAHLSGCVSCGQIARDFESTKRMLRALPAAAPSAGFDAALAQRLALTRRPVAPVQTWRTKIAAVFAPPFATPARRLRPALALGMAAAAGTAVFFFPVRSPNPVPVAAIRSADPAFVADCVAQHHRDAAAEPLADLSAQSLAGSLDNSASGNSNSENTAALPADPNSPSDPSLL